MPVRPRVAVIVLNYNGVDHLRLCLPSLEALDYDNVEIVVADNGSGDDSVRYVRSAHPGARVIEMGQNLGFSRAYNRAVPQTEADYVVLLNNDTRVAAGWLTALVSAAERHQAAAAASAMLDWNGERIDFVGGLPTILGHAWQSDQGQPVGTQPLPLRYPERRLLFGCGGSVMIRRDAYLQCGGFDEDLYAYFEDVDLGWRMNLLGHATVFAPEAITYHRLHGTWGGWAHALRLRLYERNALAMLVKNLGDDALARTLSTALALTIARTIAAAGLADDIARFGSASPTSVSAPPQLVAALIGIEDFARAMPALMRKRSAIQASRRVSDEEIFRLMPEPLKLHNPAEWYGETAAALIRDFRIAELVGLPAPTRPVAVGAPVADVTVSGEPPRVSVVVLTASGARHLPACLDSLRQHSWPPDRTEVIVVDNGSTEDPTSVVERHYPGARVVRTGANLGFSGGNNAGARVATGDWLVFLNDDTRVEAAWLDEMMGVARRRNAASVGAFIVDWAGERVDFAGGLVNFEGRGYSQGYDLPVADADLSERPLLFGCGAAVLFRRDVFEESGGWDEPTFAYYEDVEFGWRLWLLGHEVWFAPKAVVYHRHHGTSGSESPARVRAFERNALRMLYSLLEEDSLQAVLPAALLLAVDRALLATPFSRADDGIAAPRSMTSLTRRLQPAALKTRLLHALSRRGARRQYGAIANLRRVGARGLAGSVRDVFREVRDGWESSGGRVAYLIEQTRGTASLEGRSESIPINTAAQLLGIGDFLRMLPELSRRRAWLQAKRRRTDAEIIKRFGGCWRNAVPSPHITLHVELRTALADTLSSVLSGLPATLDLSESARETRGAAPGR